MTVIAGLTNMVLDALFIAVFKWGLVGAALATGLSQCIGGVLPLIYFMSPKNDTALKFVKTKLEGTVLLKACANGVSELMTTVSSSLVSMLLQLPTYETSWSKWNSSIWGSYVC